MADKTIPNLTATPQATFDDLLLVVDTPASAPTNKKITLANLFNKIPTTIGYGSDAVGTVNVSDTTQALDGKAVFLCTGTGSATRVATMSDGDHIGQTITVILVGSAAAYVTYIQFEGESTGNNILLEQQIEESNVDNDYLVLDTEGTTPADFKITVSNLLAPSASGDSVISIPSVGSSATLMWTGSNWIITSLIGDATTTT